MADKKKYLDKLTTGWASRTLTTGRMAATLGKAALAKTINTALDREGSPAEEEDDEGAIARAEALVDKMDNLKGLMMKFGQMVSYLDASMPENAQRVLRKLQQGSKPLVYSEVENVVLAAFGEPIEALFESFEPEPFAAASIGQVHRAVYGGRQVAVKVQYPEIAKTLDIDLGNLKAFARFGTIGTAMQSGEMVRELRERMLEECNYLQEAAFQRHFVHLMADLEGAQVPTIVEARCGPTVITSEFVQGKGFYDFIDGASQAERDAVGELIFEASFGAIFRHSMFNGDPHPGNYIFKGGGQVAFIDYGCVKTFDATFMRAWKRLALTVLDGRRRDFEAALAEVGLARVGKKFDYDYQWKVMQYLYTPFLKPDFRYNHTYVSESYDTMIWKNPNRMRTPMPANWLFLNRLQWGLNSVLAHLEARGRWGEIFRALVETPSIEGVKPPALLPLGQRKKSDT